MVTTVGALVNAEAVLNHIAAQRLPAARAYGVARLLASVRTEIAGFVSIRDDLIRQYGGPARNNVIEVLPEHRAVYLEQLETLAAVQVSLDTRWLLTRETLETVPLSADDVLQLGSLLVDPEGTDDE